MATLFVFIKIIQIFLHDIVPNNGHRYQNSNSYKFQVNHMFT